MWILDDGTCDTLTSYKQTKKILIHQMTFVYIGGGHLTKKGLHLIGRLCYEFLLIRNYFELP